MALLISMLKTILLLEKLTFEKLEISDNEVSKIGISSDGIKHIRKSKKLKAQKLSKSGKKLQKNRNLPNFNAKKIGPNFLTFNIRKAFNYL